jgi:hypothetical protein
MTNAPVPNPVLHDLLRALHVLEDGVVQHETAVTRAILTGLDATDAQAVLAATTATLNALRARVFMIESALHSV